MKKTIISILLISVAICAWAGENTQIKSFEELMNYLKNGKEVSVVLHYAKCELISDNEIVEDVPDAIGGMILDVWEYFAPMVIYNEKAFLVSSTSKLIQYPKGDGYVYNYVKIRFYDDNSVKITAEYLDAETYEVKMTENFYGNIADGKNKEGIYIYVD